METLRERLKRETSAPHERLDARLSKLDLRTAHGLSVFLRLHRKALLALLPILSATQYDFSALITKSEADLSLLAAPIKPKPFLTHSQKGHPLGYAYVLAGASMGTAFLNRERLSSADPAVLASSHFMESTIGTHIWKVLRVELEARPGAGPEADAIVEGALACFEHFYHAANAMNFDAAEPVQIGEPV